MQCQIKYFLLVKIFIFINYFSISKAQIFDSTGDLPSYPTLPISYEKCVEKNESLQTCQTKSWFKHYNIKMRNHFKKLYNVTEENCLEACLITYSTNCTAIMIKKNVTSRTTCVLFNATKKAINEAEFSKTYWVFQLLCCEEKIPVKINNDIRRQNLTMIYNKTQNCDPLSIDQDLTTCTHLAWHMHENVSLTFKAYHESYNIDIMDCFAMCAKTPECFAFGVEEYEDYLSTCYFFKYGKSVKFNRKFSLITTSYEIICCKPILYNLWTWNDLNLLLLHDPYKFCSTVDYETIRTTCKTKIWHVEAGVRMKGYYNTTHLTTVKDCLNECLKSKPCIGISVDRQFRRCLYFQGEKNKNYTKHPGQLLWYSYILTCCKITNDENNSLRNSDSPSFPHYPVVFNPSTDCKSFKNDSNNCQTTIVWEGNILKQLTLDFHTAGSIKSDADCLNLCLTNQKDKCTGIARKSDEPEICFLYNKSAKIRNSDTRGPSRIYNLSCCDLNKKIFFNNPLNNLPIVLNPKENCYSDDLDVGIDSCEYKSWYMHERTDIAVEWYRFDDNMFTMDCLNKCSNDYKCIAVVVEILNGFTSKCYYYHNYAQKEITDVKKTYYKKICCFVNNLKKLNGKNIDFLLLYEPEKICNVARVANKNKTCPVKIWHVEDGINWKNYFAVFPLVSTIKYCLHQCIDNKDCLGVTIDFDSKRCFFYNFEELNKKENKIVQQPGNFLYTLKCCDNKIKFSSQTLNIYDDSELPVALPLIFKFDEECLPMGYVKKLCRRKVWRLRDNIKLGNNSFFQFMKLETCLQHCAHNSDCVAVSKDKLDNSDSFCFMYHNDYQITNDSQYKSYFLECCDDFTLNEKFIGAGVYYLPILLNIQGICPVNNLNNLNSCTNDKVWNLLENSDLTTTTTTTTDGALKVINNKDIIECLNECVSEKECKTVVVEDKNDYERVCHLLKTAVGDNIKSNVNKKSIYKMVCCNTQEAVKSLRFKLTNIMMLYEPSRICQSIELDNVKFCEFKIWHILENVRIISNYKSRKFSTKITTIKDCLDLCSESEFCADVSFDFNAKKCFFFHRLFPKEKNYGLNKWISFSLQCCFL